MTETPCDKILDKLDVITRELSLTRTELARHDVYLREQEKRVEQFWNRDWPQISSAIIQLNDRVHVIEKELIGIKIKVSIAGAIFGFITSVAVTVFDKIVS